MLRLIAIAAAVLGTITAAEAAKPRTLEEAALQAALYKGYRGQKAKCYAEVSTRYYDLGWQQGLVVTGRKMDTWKLELWQRCGISR